MTQQPETEQNNCFIVSHGNDGNSQFNLSVDLENAQSDFYYVFFYNDCHISIPSVSAGNRVFLVYSISYPPDTDLAPPTAASLPQPSILLAPLFERWSRTNPVRPMIFLLREEYRSTEKESWPGELQDWPTTLKGADLGAFMALKHASPMSGHAFGFRLCSLVAVSSKDLWSEMVEWEYSIFLLDAQSQGFTDAYFNRWGDKYTIDIDDILDGARWYDNYDPVDVDVDEDTPDRRNFDDAPFRTETYHVFCLLMLAHTPEERKKLQDAEKEPEAGDDGLEDPPTRPRRPGEPITEPSTVNKRARTS
jgi:hypothetical protein